jgi:hypothetical protein
MAGLGDAIGAPPALPQFNGNMQHDAQANLDYTAMMNAWESSIKCMMLQLGGYKKVCAQAGQLADKPDALG